MPSDRRNKKKKRGNKSSNVKGREKRPEKELRQNKGRSKW